jgi:hypothetical protein
MLGGSNTTQSLDGKRISSLTINTEIVSGNVIYRGYHQSFNAADGDTAWMIDKWEYDVNDQETKRLTYDDAAATWTDRATYF